MSLAPSASNLLLGKGKLFFDEYSNGVLTGELDLGNCETFEISPTTDVKIKKSSMDSAAGTLKRTVASTAFEVAITGSEFSKENLALVFLGDTTTLVQTGSTATDELVTSAVKHGRYYPVAKRQISSVTVKHHATTLGSATTATVTTDYTIDAETGRIYIVPGGGITEGNKVWVSYTYASETLQKVRAGTLPSKEGFLRYVSDNAAGGNTEVRCWRVMLNPDGALGFISDDFATFTLKGEIQYDTTRPTEPYFVVLER